MQWLVSQPFIITVTVGSQHQDEFGHTNNIAYLKWLEQIAWAHSNYLGLTIDTYKRLGCGCVVRKHELNDLLPTYLGDELHIATWISANDGKLSTVRDYQIIRQSDGKTVFTGRTNFITVDMVTGKPKRMPVEFIEAYIPALTSP